MTILTVLRFPDPRLRTKAQPVINITSATTTIINDMLATMYDEKGVGLAATQVDIHQRIVVMDTSENYDQPIVLINPEIIATSDETSVNEEGCLSVPNQFAEIDRPKKCEIEYLDYNGKKKTLKAEGLLATCIQHEMDHLEGILFIDYLSKLKKSMIIKKLSKIKSTRIVV